MSLGLLLEKLEGPELDAHSWNLIPEAFGSAFHYVEGEISSHLV